MSMSPVALVYLPDQPFLLGTFDVENFKTWWRSRPFPEAIDFIKKGMHIYGRKHLVIAKRADGRWAVYISRNYGIDWELAFLAAEGEIIYDMVLIKFGWAVLNTSTGFYRTVKAGVSGSWTKISSLPGASAVPAFANIGNGDILLCTDGRYIWRSTNYGVSWSLVCDQASIGRGFEFSSSGKQTKSSIYWTGSPRYAAIAGANGVAMCAYGPWTSWSNDGGVSWMGNEFWDGMVWWPGFTDESGKECYPSPDIFWNRMPKSASANANFVIKQILVSEAGRLPSSVKFVVRIDDLNYAPGEQYLFSRVMYAYLGWFNHRIIGETSPDPYPKLRYRFQQFISPDESLNQIACYETQILGTEGTDRVVVSSQTTVDSQGNPIPSFKYSIDGGYTWITLKVGDLKVGDENDAPVYGGSFLDNVYTKAIWVWGTCSNVGRWNSQDSSITQTQSYDMDVEIEGWRWLTEDDKVDAIIEKDGEEPESVDAILEKSPTEPYPVDGLFEGVATKSYRVDRTLEGISEKDVSVDSIVTIDKSEDDSVDAIFEKNIRLIYKVDMGLHDKNSRSYLVDTKLVKDDLNKRLARVRRTFPQVFDLWLPEIPQGVYNSVWEIIE